MGDVQLSSAHDIEKLKQKITTYRETLTMLKADNSTEDDYRDKEEFQSFKTKITDLEELMEIMDEENSMQIQGYKEEIKNFTVQIDSLNQTIEDLNQKISSIMSKIDEGNNDNLIEEQNPGIVLQGSMTTREIDFMNDTPQNIGQSTFPSIPKSDLPPSYNQFQKILSQSKSIKELPNGSTLTEGFNFPRNSQEGQQYSNKRNTPLNNMSPSQFYNSMHKSNNPKFAGYRNNPFPIKGIPIKGIETNPIPLTNSTPTNNEVQQEFSKHEPDVPPIGGQEQIEKAEEAIQKNDEPVEMIEEAIQEKEGSTVGVSESIQKNDEPIVNVNETIPKKEEPIAIVKDPILKNDEPVAVVNEPILKKVESIAIVEEPILKKEEQIEVSNNAKQQENKSNEPLSFLKLFWKKLK
ncbi:hypothetical protein MHZ95_10540 [Sporosarcina sp. ACRSM]|uniref:hypothetical protein n=1 Tax=Sporosarcina sp. ACRSM TaxID=2918216 RepID=UPI001EF751DC|nr:hypothetical protein [Sporosarcina sp. ACRSM]MCG7335716.1 hypothetical protein [Sporosarcina sp. ACRSM]